MLRLYNVYLFFCCALILLPRAPVQASADQQSHGTLIQWFDGSPAQAFAHAKATKKSLFIYFGATWCPPCNEMKSFVFSNPQGAESLKNFVRVYLDGDHETAQSWAEKLKLGGYPTMVFLTEDGEEVSRILGSVSLKDFLERVEQAKAGQALTQVIARALTKGVSNDQWKIVASSHWPEAENTEAADVVAYAEKISKLLKKIPSELTIERSLLNAKLLQVGLKLKSDDKEPKVLSLLKDIKSTAPQLMSALWATDAAMIANQENISFYSGDFIDSYISGKSTHSLEKQKFYKKWKSSLEFLRNSKEANPNVKLYAWVGLAKCSEFLAKDKKIDTVLIEKIKADIQGLVKVAISDFDRQALIPNAADVLIEIGAPQEAKEMLLTELKTTKVPWLIYSNLARLEENHGSKQEALKYMDLASQTVQGRASKAQWISSHLMMTIRLDGKQQGERINKLIQEYFGVVFELDDGFEGRNKSRLKSLRKSLKEYFSPEQSKSFIQSYSAKCATVRQDLKGECERYFAEF